MSESSPGADPSLRTGIETKTVLSIQDLQRLHGVSAGKAMEMQADVSESFLAFVVKSPSQYDSLCRTMAAEIIRLRSALQQSEASLQKARMVRCEVNGHTGWKCADCAEASLKEAQERIRQLEWWVRSVLHKFKADEAAGYHTKDRQYAISMLGKGLEVSGQGRTQIDTKG